MRPVTFNPPHKEALSIMDGVNQLSVELKRQQDHNYRLVKALTILLNDPNAGKLAFSSCQEARTALGLWNSKEDPQ